MSYTTPKTTRGVQESDVWAAADAVLMAGERPTIERVRQHMGRGSPNTVGPMLESWFTHLGERLAQQQGQSTASAMPELLHNLMQQLWQAALEQAQTQAQQAWEARSAALHAQAEELAHTQAQLAQRAETLAQQKKTMDEALQLAHAQQADLAQQLKTMQQQGQEQEQVIDGLRAELTQQAQQREVERQQQAQERQRLSEQFAGNERRWLTELDRSRQELEKQRKLQQEQAQQLLDQRTQWQTKVAELEHSLLQAGNQAHTQEQVHQQAAALAQERMQHLQWQLEQAQERAALAELAQGAATGTDKRAGLSVQRRALLQRAQRFPKK